MIDIRPASLDALRATPEIAEAVRRVCTKTVEHWPSRGDDPFVQISYDDLGIEAVERLFSYADIATVNTPVGAPCDFTPLSKDKEWVVFPLKQLRSAIAAIRSNPKSEIDDAVIVEVLSCIDFAQSNNLVMLISW